MPLEISWHRQTNLKNSRFICPYDSLMKHTFFKIWAHLHKVCKSIWYIPSRTGSQMNFDSEVTRFTDLLSRSWFDFVPVVHKWRVSAGFRAAAICTWLGINAKNGILSNHPNQTIMSALPPYHINAYIHGTWLLIIDLHWSSLFHIHYSLNTKQFEGNSSGTYYAIVIIIKCEKIKNIFIKRKVATKMKFLNI